MKKIVLKTAVIFLMVLAISCTGTRKFDYTNAYKFSYIENHAPEISLIEPLEVKPLAQLNNNSKPELPMAIQSVQRSGSVIQSELFASNPKAIRQAYRNLTKDERKQVRMSLKQSIRDLKSSQSTGQEISANVDSSDDALVPPEQDQKKKRIAKYLLIGGGAIMIIGIIASVTAVTTIGVVAIVAGAVLMLLSLNG